MNLFRFVPGYTENIYDAGKEPLLFLFLAFLITFALVRLYTRMARTRGWGSGNVGGVHMHHMVPGIILMAIGGGLGFTQFSYNEIVYSIAAILFGIGGALTLDEFAMILHLKDVYWAEEGRASVDAMLMGVAAAGLLLVTAVPTKEDSGLYLEIGDFEIRVGLWIALAINLVLVAITFLKKKPFIGVVGIFVILISIPSAIRLAKPGSPWARLVLRPGSRKRAPPLVARAQSGQERAPLHRRLVGTVRALVLQSRRRHAASRLVRRRARADALKILYGVQGEGMGHAMRAGVVLESLTKEHDVRVVASGRGFEYLAESGPHVHEIWGLSFAKDGAEIRMLQSLIQNLGGAVTGWPRDLRKYFELAEEFRPDVVISDFESFSVLFAQRHQKPIVSLDNIQMIDRCKHDGELLKGYRDDFHVARAYIAMKVPRAFHYLVTTFFYPELRRKRTTLVPSIVRQEIIDSEPERGEHLLVYSSGDEAATAALRTAGLPCRIYGMRSAVDGHDEIDGNLTFRPFSAHGFADDLRTCRGLVTGGGYTLLSEAVYLHKPILSIPLAGQAEQQLNARYLARLGYGAWAPALTEEVLAGFLSRLPEYEEGVAGYEQEGNTAALATLDDVLVSAASAKRDYLGRRRPA